MPEVKNKVYLRRSSAINEQSGGLAGFPRCITSTALCGTGSGEDTFRSGVVISKWSSGLVVTFVFVRPRGSCNATPVTNRPGEIEKWKNPTPKVSRNSPRCQRTLQLSQPREMVNYSVRRSSLFFIEMEYEFVE